MTDDDTLNLCSGLFIANLCKEAFFFFSSPSFLPPVDFSDGSRVTKACKNVKPKKKSRNSLSPLIVTSFNEAAAATAAAARHHHLLPYMQKTTTVRVSMQILSTCFKNIFITRVFFLIGKKPGALAQTIKN